MYELKNQLFIQLTNVRIREELDLDDGEIISLKDIMERIRKNYPDVEEKDVSVKMSSYDEDGFSHESSEVFFFRDEREGERIGRIKDLVMFNNYAFKENKKRIDYWNEKHPDRKVEGTYEEIIERFTGQEQKEFKLEDYV